MSKTKPKLMIIDGNALIHRSFHALPPTMTTKDGEMVNAVYGFVSFLIKAMRELKPEYVVLTLDKKGPTFRHKKYKEYKAKRVKAPDELYAQFNRVKEITEAFNIPIFEMSGFEADDLIGTIARLPGDKIEKIIVTGDMDTLQLINDHTKIYTMSRGLNDSITYDANQVHERYGITPEQMIDYKALRGDPSDNLPGVAGIGEKTAVILLLKYKTLDSIYKELKENSAELEKIVTPRIVGLLREHKKEAYLSQDLATIKCDVPLKFDLESTRFKDLDKQAVIDKLGELEFNSLLPRMQSLFNEQVSVTREEKLQISDDKFNRNKKQFKYILVNDEKTFDKFLKELVARDSFTFDTETSSFDPITAELLGISFSWKKGEAYFVDFGCRISDVGCKDQNNLFTYKVSAERSSNSLGTGSAQSEEFNLFTYKNSTKHPSESPKAGSAQSVEHVWLKKLKPIFEDEKIKKSAHNAKFDVRVMCHNGIDVRGLDFDSMIASYLLSPGSRGHGLDPLSFTELGFEKISKDDLLGKGRERIGFSEVDTEKLMLYSCEDADFTGRLVNKLAPRLKEQKLFELFKMIEMPLVSVLAQIEDNGCLIDKEFLAKMSLKLAKKIKILEEQIQKLAGSKFNIKSTQQLKEVLFEKLAIPSDGIKHTKTGLSTAADELDKLKDEHPIIRLIQEHRELCKLTSTYINALPELINKKTGRLHAHFNQTVTATGRLSSSDPNLQNIPVRTELGREIRKAFTAAPGNKLLALDYSQIELRLAAHMSGDKKMIDAFKNGVDIHTATAAEINQISPEAVDEHIRREAKAINFGILYGQGAHGLSRTADIPYARAREFIEQYFIVYKDIKKYIDNTIKETRAKGYVSTLFDRRRYLPEINSTVQMVKKAAERMAINTPLQGSSADMIKIAMIDISKTVTSPDVRMLLQVHDELVFEVKESEIKEAAKKIKDIMENVIKLKVPIVVDVKAGDNWGEMEAISDL